MSVFHPQQPSSTDASPAEAQPVARGALPPTVRWATLSLAAHTVLHLSVPLIMELQRGQFVALFQRLYPGQTLSQITALVGVVLTAGLIYHVLFAVLFSGFALALRSGRRWTRLGVTLVCVLGMLGTVFSFSSPTPTTAVYKTLNLISWLLALTTLGLIWLSPAARVFFARRRQAAA